MRILQHGDVILREIEKIPEGFKKIKIEEGFIVEKGEGIHTHVLTATKGCEAYKDDFGNLLLKIKNLSEYKKVTIDHEEHGKMVLPKGIFVKYIENEYDVELDETRKTKD
jgi:hypothetical protein